MPAQTSIPADCTIRRPTLDDVPEILAVVHASDIAAVGEPDFTADEVVEILDAPNHDPARDSWLALDPAGRLVGWAYLTTRPAASARTSTSTCTRIRAGRRRPPLLDARRWTGSRNAPASTAMPR